MKAFHVMPNRTRWSLVRRSAAAAAFLPFLACSGDGTSSSASRVSIKLTDAPGDMKKAVVTISEIYLQGSGGRVVLMNTPVTTDLLTLANSTSDLVKDAMVPAGHYSELRFVVTGGYIELDDSAGFSRIYATSPSYAGLPAGSLVTGNLQTPSFSTSGVKVKLPGNGAFDVSGEQKVVLVDFDVSQSFGKAAGNGGQWVMTPVMTASDFQLTGGLTVTLRKDSSVALPQVNGAAMTLGQANAVLTKADGGTESVAFTDPDGDGTWSAEFRFLAPASYSVDVQGPSGTTLTTNPGRPATATVASAQQVTMPFRVTGAK